MNTISLRLAEPRRDFAQLAALFSHEQDEPISETGLMEDYAAHKERIIRLMVTEDEQGELLGFNWVTRSRFDATQAYFYVIVKPEQRGRGAGRRLYEDVEQVARKEQLKQLRIDIRDNEPDSLAFAERRGFTERNHSIGMALNLETFDDKPYDEVIARLKDEGFQFTSLEALGNTEQAQRKLFTLNDTAAAETMGSDGQHPWLSFEEFQKMVCGSNWYKPDGQLVVIDSATGDWAAMSAITCFEGCDYAYNLFTGVDKRYRSRKLAQAVKVLALRYARHVLKVHTVRTNHNSKNVPILAIDHKFGYVQTPGTFSMEKILE